LKGKRVNRDKVMVTEMMMLNIRMMAMMKPAMFFSKCAIQNRCSMSVEIDQMPRSVWFVECEGDW
jgi:hypothetical protein